jgi:hypothetical protein
MEAARIMHIIDLDAMKVIQSITIHVAVMDNLGYRCALEEVSHRLHDLRAYSATKIDEVYIQRGKTDGYNFYRAEPAQIYPFAFKCNTLGSFTRF